eukprot:scaffold24174_cov117-Cylindrotheca_fusiformis.AAC.2
MTAAPAPLLIRVDLRKIEQVDNRMSSTVAGNSRTILHILPDNGTNDIGEMVPVLRRDDENDEGSRLVVQNPIHFRGTASQIIQHINSRIKPLEIEPRMFLRTFVGVGGRPDAEENTAAHAEDFELVVTASFRDDVRILVKSGDDLNSILKIMAGIHVETVFLYAANTPGWLTTSSIGKVLSNHPTLKRLWLVTGPDFVEDDINFSVAASIIQESHSPIRELIIEGYGGESTAALSKHQEAFFKAIEQSSSLLGLAFVRTAFLNTATLSRLGQALCSNCSIETLYLGSLDDAEEAGIMEFARCIPKMNHLKVLDIRQVHRLVFTRPNQRLNYSTAKNVPFEPVIYGLMENWSLTKIQGSRRYTKDLSPTLQNLMDLQLKLNRSCAKQFVKQPTTTPNIWPFVLTKCNDSPTALYYCLREKVVSACT